MKVMKIILMIAGVSLLAGCEFDGAESAKKAAAPATQNQKCNQWCHNGWCTTHCDDVVATS